MTRLSQKTTVSVLFRTGEIIRFAVRRSVRSGASGENSLVLQGRAAD